MCNDMKQSLSHSSPGNMASNNKPKLLLVLILLSLFSQLTVISCEDNVQDNKKNIDSTENEPELSDVFVEDMIEVINEEVINEEPVEDQEYGDEIQVEDLPMDDDYISDETPVITEVISEGTDDIFDDDVFSKVEIHPISTNQVIKKRPNILLIMADDLGIGDIGCFGNNTIRTPNIDRMAREGVKLGQHLAAAPLCTPSRAAFMTGRYPIRFGMAPRNLVRVSIDLSSTNGIPDNETTFGEVAKEQGYSTALIGKWHLGLNCKGYDFCHHPLNQGFDYYYGIPLSVGRGLQPGEPGIIRSRFPNMDRALYSILGGGVLMALMLLRRGVIGKHGFFCIVILSVLPAIAVNTVLAYMRYFNRLVMRNYDVVEQHMNLSTMTQRLVDEGIGYLEARQEDQQPFLLVMSWAQVHTSLHSTYPFKGRSAHGRYGDEVEEMDWSVGEILNALDDLGFTDNTFVYFTSDHGGHVEEKDEEGNREGGWNGVFKGGKGQGGWEGGIRVPTLARWPGVILPGTTSDLPTSQMDIIATVAGMIEGRVPDDRIIDGTDILPVMRGDHNAGVPHRFLVHYCGDQIHAARYVPGDGTDVYKVHYVTPKWEPGTQGCGFICGCWGNRVDVHDPPLMFNIAKDPGETKPLDVTMPYHRELLVEINQRVEQHKASLEQGIENQFWWRNILPKPWLNPCFNFPHFTCPEAEDIKARQK